MIIRTTVGDNFIEKVHNIFNDQSCCVTINIDVKHDCMTCVYGKPNGAKFKKQHWLHVQQISCQGQETFRSSSTKLASRSTNVLSRSRDISIKLNKIGFTFNKCLVKVKRYFDQAQQNWLHVQQMSCQGQEIFRPSSTTEINSDSMKFPSDSRGITSSSTK